VSSTTLRVGVVGTTPYAESHIVRINAHPRATVVAVAGRDRPKANAVATRNGIAAVFDGYERMLDSKLLDALVIVAPDDLHEAIAVRALQAGLHVLCEKPLAASSEAARRMARAAAASGRVNMSYFALRTSGHHRYLRDLLAGGAIGRVQTAAFSLTHGFFRTAQYNWRFDAALGGGVIADLGCYLFDLARWYVGEVRAVAVHGASLVERPHPDGTPYAPAHDSAVGLLAFSNGAHATFEANVLSHVGPGKQQNTVHLQGEHGRLELQHTFDGAHIRLLTDGDGTWREQTLPRGFDAPSGDAEFLDAILADRPLRPNFTDGWRVQQVVSAAETAAQKRIWTAVEREDGP